MIDEPRIEQFLHTFSRSLFDKLALYKFLIVKFIGIYLQGKELHRNNYQHKGRVRPWAWRQDYYFLL